MLIVFILLLCHTRLLNLTDLIHRTDATDVSSTFKSQTTIHLTSTFTHDVATAQSSTLQAVMALRHWSQNVTCENVCELPEFS